MSAVDAEQMPSTAFICSAIVSLRRQHRRETRRLIPLMQQGDQAARARAEAIVAQVADLEVWLGGLGITIDPCCGSTLEELLDVGDLYCAVDDEQFLMEEYDELAS